MTAVWQHHSGGRYIGGTIWDIFDLIRNEDPQAIGFSFDIGHAVVEGGNIWKINTRLALPRAYSIVAKDFYWQKTGGSWRVHWCPIGDGMIPFQAWFSEVAASTYRGPLSALAQNYCDVFKKSCEPAKRKGMNRRGRGEE